MEAGPLQLDPWLSVIVPVFNGARYLSAALDSVLTQADPGVEIVVADDGSTDASPSIVASARAAGKRVVSVGGPRRHNWVANSNHAIACSRGAFITFLHQDDLWLPGRLEETRRVIARDPNCNLWIAPTRFIDRHGRMLGTLRLPIPGGDKPVDGLRLVERLLVQNFIGMPTPVFPRAAFDSVGGAMDESLWYTADWDLWLRLALSGRVHTSRNALTAFRLHNESQTVQGTNAPEIMFKQTEVVRARYLGRIIDEAVRVQVDRAGRLSSEVNFYLAAAVSRQPRDTRALIASLLRTPPAAMRRFVRDSRIFERIWPRLRLGLAPTRE